MSLLAWIVLGLVAGLIARAVYPGRQALGVVGTLLLGIVGAVLGGWFGRETTGGGVTGLTFGSIVWAVVGAVILLFFWGLAVGRRGRGPVTP